MRRPLASLVVFALLGHAIGCTAGRRGDDPVVSPVARAVSAPYPVNQVQDCAFWVHPTDPAKGLLLVTNEHRGLEVHDGNGTLLKVLADDCGTQYVDVLYGFDLAGTPTDLVLVSCTTDGLAGVKVWPVNREKGKLGDELTAGPVIKVLGGDAPLGLCAYRSPKTGKSYVYVTLKAGRVEQSELLVENGKITAKPVRTIDLKAETKGLVVDPDYGALYVTEVKTGVWRYDAEPTGGDARKLVIKAGEHRLTPGLKGPAIYLASGGRGYLLVVSQAAKTGQSVVNVYDRTGDNAFVLTIDPSPRGVGPINHSSGLDVTNRPFGPRFPAGVLAVNDQQTPIGSEDFKLYGWDDIARAGGLIVDPAFDPLRR